MAADILRSFIEKIKSIGFLERLFSWKTVRTQMMEAAASLSSLLNEVQGLQTSRAEMVNELNNYKKDLSLARESILDLNRRLAEQTTHAKNNERQAVALDNELTAFKEKVQHLQGLLKQETETCLRLKEQEEARNREHAAAMATLTSLHQQVRQEREDEKNLRQQQELERLQNLKATWVLHETQVRNALKAICNKQAIAYVDEVPFKGTPDNTLKICDEYIVFDAKSPAGDDLSNFPSYLKDQAEKARKYAKQEQVKTDIFFVVPSNTLEQIRHCSYHMGDFDVYVIPMEALEPVILALKKIENYEFARQLTPEERENICRVIGKFAHLTKRRIQIDSFFARQFIEIVYRCESSLPEDILEKVAEFERSEKLNPPMERRTKAINSKQLDGEITRLETEIGSKGIVIEDLSDGLNKVKLYKTE